MELRLIDNPLVFVPMLVAMYLHRYPRAADAHTMRCSCAVGALELA